MNSDSGASTETAPLTDTYVQEVPDKCDRIIWRGQYYHLPIGKATTAASLVDGVNGECVECGTDPETGDIRIIIKTTMEALRDGPALVYRDVTVSLSGLVKDQRLDDAAVNRALMADLPHGGKVCDYMRIPNHDTLEDVMRAALEAALGREVGDG